MKNARLIFVFVSFGIAIFIFLVWWRWRETPFGEYRKFTDAYAVYYSKVADACDVLIKQLPRDEVLIPFIPGDDRSVPKILRDLKASSFYVSTNQVFARFGTGLISTTISWESDPLNPAEWNLVAIAGDGDKRKVVFSRPAVIGEAYEPHEATNAIGR